MRKATYTFRHDPLRKEDVEYYVYVNFDAIVNDIHFYEHRDATLDDLYNSCTVTYQKKIFLESQEMLKVIEQSKNDVEFKKEEILGWIKESDSFKRYQRQKGIEL